MKYYINKYYGGSDIKDVKLIGIIWDEKVLDTHVLQYLHNKKNIYIYNENWDQFLNNNDIREGSGNGIYRKYRSDSDYSTELRKKDNINAFVYGIPTGSNRLDVNLDNKYKDEITFKDILDLAINKIIECIKKNEIENVFWHIDDHGGIAYSTFDPNDKIIDYLNNNFKKKFTNFNYIAPLVDINKKMINVSDHGENLRKQESELTKLKGENIKQTVLKGENIKQTVLDLICNHIKA
jgi:hypothetical protein